MNADRIRTELEARARKRRANLNDQQVKERIDVGVKWELEEKRHYDKTIYNAPEQANHAVDDLVAFFERDPKPLTIVSGASFVGKGTLITALRERLGIQKIVLATTRERRTKEKDGVEETNGDEYEFTTHDNLKAKDKSDEYLVDQVYPGQKLWIGLDLAKLHSAAQDRSKPSLIETTPEMMKEIKRRYPKRVRTVFISCVPTTNTGIATSHLTESFHYAGVNGIGMSYSSNSAVLQVAAEWCRPGKPFLPSNRLAIDQIAKEACARESQRVGWRIGTGDVYAIVHGNVGLIHTFPDEVRFESIPHDPNWIEEHLLWAHRKGTPPHCAEGILAKLFSDGPAARKAVRLISRSALLAAAALESSDAECLAGAITKYVRDFNQWLGGSLVHDSVEEMTAMLSKRLGEKNLLATKPLGAGSAASMCVLVRDGVAMSVAQHLFTENDWDSEPIRVTHGLESRIDGTKLVVSAPYRIDLVAAADLSIDPAISCHGTCCAIAIPPRSTATREVCAGGF